ncbi:hypothetical protein SAMN02744133_111112 [Thalassospira xiamenensis M-5 = DSM 17429]|jgi:hypothetical protein|uniref:Uncharacterized protein n=1 Tax=Thalassospira permensis NBRC 106175 TaxID=1353532 RepID=A0ABR4TJD6_9PROT|nr:hypothetical protein SMB34_08565 [Thalassospira permensis NBRC 106175]OCK10240.1 hypothetical protein KO164_4422 [Thalassospira sp. KO164]PXX28800.1 hypothetical protein C7967_10990 [Thalassospira sp. 11-3]SEE91124.1 hypothetical protein SAMN04515623_4489 [Thalassospira permensis]SIT26618.1 hypothetical protein SAMN02744133_111112 [Thalassospira xiamenensis M-5 = DSM 17429]
MAKIIVDLPMPKRLNNMGHALVAVRDHFRGIGF